MAYELRNNSGNMFKNDRKQPGENTPDYRGDVMVNGKVMQIAGWVKQGKKGNFLSLSFSEPRPQQTPAMGDYQATTRQAAQDAVQRQQGRPQAVADPSPLPAGLTEPDLPF